MVMVEPAYVGSQYSKIEELLFKADKDALNDQLAIFEDISHKLDDSTLKSW